MKTQELFVKTTFKKSQFEFSVQQMDITVLCDTFAMMSLGADRSIIEAEVFAELKQCNQNSKKVHL